MEKNIKAIVLGAAILAAVIIGAAFLLPWYNVWQQEMAGRAEFAKA